MTDADTTYGDPTHWPFWQAARRHVLLLQRCSRCGHFQFYGRPFCLACDSVDVRWVSSVGTGTIYSMTTVRMLVLPELVPPYVVAIVQLDEGPRMMTNVVGGPCRIGARVRITWRERDPSPPLPVFEVLDHRSPLRSPASS